MADARERRTRPHVIVDGRRSTDPSLTTRDCADRLGVTPDFIVGEIRDARLHALVIERPFRRAIYRVSPRALDTYMREYVWRVYKPAPAPRT